MYHKLWFSGQPVNHNVWFAGNPNPQVEQLAQRGRAALSESAAALARLEAERDAARHEARALQAQVTQDAAPKAVIATGTAAAATAFAPISLLPAPAICMDAAAHSADLRALMHAGAA